MYEVFLVLLALKHINVATFCEETGIAANTMSNWKKRKNLISPEIGLRIAQYFNVTLDHLYTGHGPMHPINAKLSEREQTLLAKANKLNDDAYDELLNFIDFRLACGGSKKNSETKAI